MNDLIVTTESSVSDISFHHTPGSVIVITEIEGCLEKIPQKSKTGKYAISVSPFIDSRSQ